MICEDVTIIEPERMTLGNSVYIGPGCWIHAGGGLYIGTGTGIGKGPLSGSEASWRRTCRLWRLLWAIPGKSSGTARKMRSIISRPTAQRARSSQGIPPGGCGYRRSYAENIVKNCGSSDSTPLPQTGLSKSSAAVESPRRESRRNPGLGSGSPLADTPTRGLGGQALTPGEQDAAVSRGLRCRLH